MRIMVGFDGSEVAKAALVLAQKHAKAMDGTVYIVTALEEPPADPIYKDIKIASGVSPENASSEYKQALNRINNAKTIFDGANIPNVTRILDTGLAPGEALVEFARENNIKEIIIGAKKRSRVEKLLFGSNAQFIVLHAECPVITVK